VLHCEVFADVISEIRMKTTTRTVFKDRVEMLTIEGTDPEGSSSKICDYLLTVYAGNSFGTLEGIEFEWGISHNTTHRSLKVVPFKGSQMETHAPNLLLQMEREVLLCSH
jgi:hypothetical protein